MEQVFTVEMIRAKTGSLQYILCQVKKRFSEVSVSCFDSIYLFLIVYRMEFDNTKVVLLVE